MAGNIDFFTKDMLSNSVTKQSEPFFTLKGKSDQDKLKYLKQEVVNREKFHESFFRLCQLNLQAYKGDYHSTGGRQSESLERMPMRRTSKYCVNYIHEMTENLVSRMTRLKPAIEVNPANDEFEDKNSAKAVTLLMKHIFYLNDIDILLQKLHRHKYIFGNAFLNICWDKEKGDLHPDYIKIRDSGKLNEDGELKKMLEVPIRTGDVKFEMIVPWRVLLETGVEMDESKTVIIKEVKHIEELKLEFPDKANQIKTVEHAKEFNLDTLSQQPLGKQLVVYTLYHKADDNFPMGKKIKFINNLILEEGSLGLSHGSFPFIRLTDIDVPGKQHGMSRFQQVLLLQNAHNNLSQSIMKNEFLMSAPKWIMPRGSCKMEQLGNGRTIVQYQGAVPPQLVQMNPTSATSFGFRDQIEAEIGRGMRVNETSRGEPPKGITAAVALQFLNEQDNERSVSDISKHNLIIVEIAKKTIAVAGDNYKPDDGRMVRILGKENKHMIKYFDAANLHKDYDVRIANSSALPQSKAARMERILQTMQYAPALFTPERWAELLQFGSVEKMHTLATEAITSAESENEDILEGNPVSHPEEYEDHITHLRVHYKKMQARSFKEDVPEERKEALIQHIKVTEMLAEEKAAVNPLFAAKLSQIEQFPMFWKSAAVPKSREQLEAEIGGQANRGEEITEKMPAQEPESIPGEQTNNIKK